MWQGSFIVVIPARRATALGRDNNGDGATSGATLSKARRYSVAADRAIKTFNAAKAHAAMTIVAPIGPAFTNNVAS
jgi:hypothetical protein